MRAIGPGWEWNKNGYDYRAAEHTVATQRSFAQGQWLKMSRPAFPELWVPSYTHRQAHTHIHKYAQNYTHKASWLQSTFSVASVGPYVRSAGNCVGTMDASDYLGQRWRMMAARGGWNSDKGGKGRSKGTIDANGGGLHGVRYERDYAMITPPPGCTSNAYKERSRSPRMKQRY